MVSRRYRLRPASAPVTSKYPPHRRVSNSLGYYPVVGRNPIYFDTPVGRYWRVCGGASALRDMPPIGYPPNSYDTPPGDYRSAGPRYPIPRIPRPAGTRQTQTVEYSARQAPFCWRRISAPRGTLPSGGPGIIGGVSGKYDNFLLRGPLASGGVSDPKDNLPVVALPFAAAAHSVEYAAKLGFPPSSRGASDMQDIPPSGRPEFSGRYPFHTMPRPVGIPIVRRYISRS